MARAYRAGATGFSLSPLRGHDPDVPRSAILRASQPIWLYGGTPMPKAIQIRDVPDDVHAVLRARAAAAGMSLSDYLRLEITRLAGKPTVADVIARVRTRHGGASREEIVAAVRAGRDGTDLL
jgi:plasmid stability protein